jgi:hypothetical protein
MKKRELTKSVVVHLMIFSLVQTSFPMSVTYSAEIEKNPLFQVAQIGMGVFQQAQMQKMSLNASIQAYQQQQQLLQSLKPVPTPSKFFPQCYLPPSMVNYPKNMCSSVNSAKEIQSGTAPVTLGRMNGMEQAAENAVNYYDQMLNLASNAPVTHGLRCLNDQKKNFDSSLTEMVNSLTRLQDQLNKDKQAFAAQTKEVLGKYNDLNAELKGEASKSNTQKTKNYSALYGQTCRNIIGKEAFGSNFIGFKGVLEVMRTQESSANNFTSNKARIKSDIDQAIKNMQLGIKNTGIADWKDNTRKTNFDISSMPSIKTATAKAMFEFETAHERITKELKSKYDYDAPTIDKNFSTDFGDFVSSAKDYFKRKYVNECVTGADKGIAIPVDQLLGSMTTTIQGSPGVNYLATYRSKYKEIMESGDSVDEKQNRLKELSSLYPNIQVRYANDNSSIVVEKPYDTFMKTAQSCASNFTQNQEKKVERGQVLLRELQSLHDNFATTLSDSVMNKVTNCNGEEKKEGAACTDETLNYKNDNFCLSQAEVCSNEILGCAKKAEEIVQKTQADMQKLAGSYNNAVANVIARSNSLLENQKAAVNDIMKQIQARFPGSNFKIPADMFVSIPKLENSTGEQLFNDGNMNFLDDLPKKIVALKDMLEDQKVAADAQIDDYIAEQEKAMNREKGRLEKLASECKTNADSLDRDVASHNQKGMENDAKMMGEAGKWCAKYADLSTHPNGACDKAKSLTKDMDKVVGMITNKARSIANEMHDVCNQFGGESEEANSKYDYCFNLDRKEDRKEYNEKKCDAVIARYERENADKKQGGSKKLKLDKLCKDDTTDKEFIKSLAEFGPKDKEALASASSIKDIRDLLKNNKLKNESFFDELQEMVGKGEKICATLKEKSNSGQKDKETKTAAQEGEIKKIQKELDENKTAAVRDGNDNTLKNKLDEDKKKIEARLDAANKKLAELQEIKPDTNNEVANLLKNFSPVETKDELKLRKIGEVGEQVDEACMAQASNNNMPKTFNSFNLQNFDASILNKGKQQ